MYSPIPLNDEIYFSFKKIAFETEVYFYKYHTCNIKCYQQHQVFLSVTSTLLNDLIVGYETDTFLFVPDFLSQ